MLAERLVRDWYRGAFWLNLLRPLSWLFERIVRARRQRFLQSKNQLWRPPVPVLIVGNITLGGTGKSPLVAALVQHFKDAGLRPGVISRGYGGQGSQYPMAVTAGTLPAQAGDEPVMLAQQLGCPLVVDPVRTRAAQYLLKHFGCDLIISDDGLQHYRLWRDLEILVVDGARGLGNGFCLPAGPLREPPSRVTEVDIVVSNGEPKFPFGKPWVMDLQPAGIYQLRTGMVENIDRWFDRKVHAVAGIGNPQRFFTTLSDLGFDVIPHAFGDHHQYNPQDLAFDDELPILMTEKDGVKCRAFADERMFELRVRATLAPEFYALVKQKLDSVRQVSQ